MTICLLRVCQCVGELVPGVSGSQGCQGARRVREPGLPGLPGDLFWRFDMLKSCFLRMSGAKRPFWGCSGVALQVAVGLQSGCSQVAVFVCLSGLVPGVSGSQGSQGCRGLFLEI